MEHVPVGLFESDEHGECQYVNPYGMALCGLTDPRQWRECIDEAVMEDVLANWERIVGERSAQRTSARLKNGRWIDIDARPLPGGGWAGTLIDATARHQREQAQETSRVLLAAAPDMIFVLDADDRFEFFRGSSGQRPLVPPEEFLGRFMHEVLPPALATEVVATRERARQTGGIATLEYELPSSAGPASFEARIGTLTDGRTMAFVRDFTDERRRDRAMEEALAAANRASRARSRFLAHVSHELRTPLNGVLGMAQLLARTSLDVDQADYLDVLRSSGETLQTVIEDILDLSRIESSGAEMLREPVDLVPALRDVAAAHRVAARERKLLLEVDLPASCWVVGHQVRIKQVVGNLLTNAVKYTPSGRVGLRLLAGETEVHIQVWDTGPGVPPQLRDAIFDAFTQVDSSSSRRHGGAGLGLTISRELAEKMGGSLRVADAPEGGALFECTLRAASTPEELEGDPTSDRPSQPPLDIVVAEDTPANALLLRVLLETAGHRVSLASDGASALAVVAEVQPDVLLLDLHMPDMDGYQAMEELRRHWPDLPVVAVTADVLPETRERCRKAGMRGFLGKPFNGAELWEALRTAVNR